MKDKSTIIGGKQRERTLLRMRTAEGREMDWELIFASHGSHDPHSSLARSLSRPLASRSVYIARIKSNQTNQTYLPRFRIQYKQEFKQHHYKRFIKYPFLCFITQAPLRRIATSLVYTCYLHKCVAMQLRCKCV